MMDQSTWSMARARRRDNGVTVFCSYRRTKGVTRLVCVFWRLMRRTKLQQRLV